MVSYSILLQVGATSDLMLAYLDFFLGGDEKRPDLPPRLYQRFPMSIIFGGDGSYMSPFSIHSDNILTSIMSQVCSTQNLAFFVKSWMFNMFTDFYVCLLSSLFHQLYGID